MKPLTGDMHMHTLASGHAYGTIREMAQSAAAHQMELIGITEHGPGIPGTCDPFYFCNFEVIPKELYGVRVYHGCEINVLNDGTLSLEERWIQRLDYGIAGIHTLCYDNAGREKNTDNLISCMRHPKIRIVSHPDDDRTPLNYERLVRAAKETHTALELNESSLRKYDRRLNCLENYRTMLRLCREQNTPIIINSDAHDPSEVGLFRRAVRFIEENRFPEELILNNGREKLEHFLFD